MDPDGFLTAVWKPLTDLYGIPVEVNLWNEEMSPAVSTNAWRHLLPFHRASSSPWLSRALMVIKKSASKWLQLKWRGGNAINGNKYRLEHIYWRGGGGLWGGLTKQLQAFTSTTSCHSHPVKLFLLLRGFCHHSEHAVTPCVFIC